MPFTDQQVRKLKSKLKPHYVRTREAEGQTLNYLEGWYVIAEANRIFGFDAWDRETSANTCVWTKHVGARYCAAYVARVRITVRAGDATVTREGCGSGESNESTPGQAHDRASKIAETDATKRALSTFGNCFGLTLYAGKTNIQDAHDVLSIAQPANNNRKNEVSGGSSVAILPNEPQYGLSHSASDRTGEPNSVEASEQEPTRAPSDPSVSAIEDAAALLGLRETKLSSDGMGLVRKAQACRIDKSRLALAEPSRIRDPAHLKYVAEQPCMICGRLPCEAHHIRYSQPRAMGRKSSDSYTVPLCATHHRELHSRGNERAWWAGRGRDPMPVADELWKNSPSQQRWPR